MDPVAIKFALVTIGLIFVLATLVILVLRLIQRVRGKKTGRSLPRWEAIGLLAFGVIFIAYLIFVPWVALVLVVLTVGGCVTSFLRLSPEVRQQIIGATFGSQVRPAKRVTNIVLAAGGTIFLVVAMLDAFK